MKIRERIEQGWLHCSIMIEVLGRPADFVSQVLKKVVGNLGKEREIQILEKQLFKPKQAKMLFSTFAEIELLVKGIGRLTDIIFDYMPSSVEIIEPTSLSLDSATANALLNDLATRLHRYDEVVKKTKLQNIMLLKKLQELTGKPAVKKKEKKQKKSRS